MGLVLLVLCLVNRTKIPPERFQCAKQTQVALFHNSIKLKLTVFVDVTQIFSLDFLLFFFLNHLIHSRILW